MKIYTILRGVKKSGKSPVFVQVWLNRERVLINTKVEADKLTFDTDKGHIKGKGKEVNDNNLIIEQVRSRVNTILVKYRLQNKEITAKLFKSEYSHPSLDIDFLEWMESEIKAKKNEVGTRRIIKYHTVLNKIKEFRPVLRFSEIDHFWIEAFRGWLKSVKKNDINTVSGNLAVLKSFCRRAVKKNLLLVDPFTDIRIGRGSVDRVFCTETELKRLWCLYQNISFTGEEHLYTVLRHFLFMCFTGLRISDFFALNFDSMVNNTIFFYPVKTRAQKKQIVKIPLNSKALQLIADEGNKEGLIFKPVTEQRMNVNLKVLASMVGINKPLTNHSGRHTFATLFIQKTSDVATLQRLLGHTRIDETMVYVHISETNLHEQMKRFDSEIDW